MEEIKLYAENMLSVLRFKKSLFAGVLDNGMDSVFIGKSRISKFMESVEKLTGGAATAVKQELKTENDVYQEICQAGASLFKAIAEGLSGDLPRVEKDSGTGKACLRLPLPDPQVVNKALPAVESLLAALKRYAGL